MGEEKCGDAEVRESRSLGRFHRPVRGGMGDWCEAIQESSLGNGRWTKEVDVKHLTCSKNIGMVSFNTNLTKISLFSPKLTDITIIAQAIYQEKSFGWHSLHKSVSSIFDVFIKI